MATTPPRPEAGFSLIEIVITAAIFAVVALVLFEIVRQSQNLTRHLAARHASLLDVRRFADRLRSEALSAEAIAVSAAPCAEIGFVQHDAAGYHFWSYRWDQSDPNPAAWSVRRYAASGPIVPCAAQSNGAAAVANVRAFSVADFDIAQLAQHKDPVGGTSDSPFIVNAMAASGRVRADIDMHVRDANDRPFIGGNHLAEITLETDAAAYTIDISPGVKPSGYEKVLQYTCGPRGGCGTDVPPAGLLAGAEIDTCSQAEAIPAGFVVPASRSHPADYYRFDACPSGIGQCLYVQYWDVVGYDQFTYTSTRHPSDPANVRTLTDWWELPGFGPTHVLAPQWDRGIWPPFPYQSANDPTMVAAAADPAQNQSTGETSAARVRSDSNACTNVRAEYGSFFNNG
ncbi:MAG: hypothetical protein NVSMB64_22550 [Candidatus Velthaea sp.]